MADVIRFLPLPPDPLRGPDFIAQLEMYLNELSTKIEEISSEIGGDLLARIAAAEELARQALTEATQARNDATQALALAQQALDAIDNVRTLAQQALDQANSAYDLAATANTTAEDAKTAADAAQDTAEGAADVAAAAQETANNALEIAEDTRNRIDDLLVYTVNEDTPNLNDITSSENDFVHYITGALNFPMEEDGFLTARVDSAERYCRQIFEVAGGDAVFVRWGTLNQDDFSETFNLSATDTATSTTSNLSLTVVRSGGQELSSSATGDGTYAEEDVTVGTVQGIWTIPDIELENGTISINGTSFNVVDGDIEDITEVAGANGTLVLAGLISQPDATEIVIDFSLSAVYTWGEWRNVNATAQVTKDEILGAVSISNVESNIDNLFGANGFYYINNEDIPALPVAEKGFLQALSDTDKTNTGLAFDTRSGRSFITNATYELTVTPGTSFYTATATSGSTSISETLVLSYTADGTMTFRSQLGGGAFNVNTSITSGVVLVDKIEFYSDNSIYSDNGFTLTITDESGAGTGDIVVEFPAYGAGDPVVTSGRANTTNSYILYQSGYLENSGGSLANIYFSATWSNATSTGAWADWKEIGGSGGQEWELVTDSANMNDYTMNGRWRFTNATLTNAPTTTRDLYLDAVLDSDGATVTQFSFNTSRLGYLRVGTYDSAAGTWSFNGWSQFVSAQGAYAPQNYESVNTQNAAGLTAGIQLSNAAYNNIVGNYTSVHTQALINISGAITASATKTVTIILTNTVSAISGGINLPLNITNGTSAGLYIDADVPEVITPLETVILQFRYLGGTVFVTRLFTGTSGPGNSVQCMRPLAYNQASNVFEYILTKDSPNNAYAIVPDSTPGLQFYKSTGYPFVAGAHISKNVKLTIYNDNDTEATIIWNNGTAGSNIPIIDAWTTEELGAIPANGKAIVLLDFTDEILIAAVLYNGL